MTCSYGQLQTKSLQVLTAGFLFDQVLMVIYHSTWYR